MMSKTKIILLVEDFRIGGLERVVETIFYGLDRERYDPCIWCLAAGGELFQRISRKGEKIILLNIKTYYNPVNIFKLAFLLRKNKIQILHAHGYFASTIGRISALLARTPVVISHVHTTYFSFSRRNKYIEKFLSYFTDRIVCVSTAAQNFVIEVEKIYPSKTCLIYNAAVVPDTRDLDEQTESERSLLGITHKDFVAISVASLTPHKGHHVLLGAATIIMREYPHFKLLIVGDGPIRIELEEHAKRAGIFNNTIFTGLRENVFPLLKLANIFVLASTEREGLGIALIEAMAAGLPVIGTRLGGIPEVIEENINGLLSAPGDVRGLATAIKILIDSKGLAERMGRQGEKIYHEKFSVPQMIRNLESLYDKLLINR